MDSDKSASRRRYSGEEKLQLLAERDAGEASVAKVAMAHGINTNVSRCRQLARDSDALRSASPRHFVPVSLSDAPAQQSVPDIRIQLRPGPIDMAASGPRLDVAGSPWPAAEIYVATVIDRSGHIAERHERLLTGIEQDYQMPDCRIDPHPV